MREVRTHPLMVGLASFYYWYGTLPGSRLLDRHLKRHLTLPGGVDGVEIHVSFEALDSWSKSLVAGEASLPGLYTTLSSEVAGQILDLDANTIHLPAMQRLDPGDDERVADLLFKLYSATGICEFTTHPDEVPLARWESFLENLAPELTLSVENMDFRRRDHRSLPEIGRLLLRYPSLSWTLDICHWIELGERADSAELLSFLCKFGNRLSKVHFSVPSSHYAAYGEVEEAISHYLLAESGLGFPETFFEFIPSHAAYVIEGVVPVGEFDLFEQELFGLRTHYSALLAQELS